MLNEEFQVACFSAEAFYGKGPCCLLLCAPMGCKPDRNRPTRRTLAALTLRYLPAMKIIDKIKHAVESKEPFYSFEFFPPKTSAGVENL